MGFCTHIINFMKKYKNHSFFINRKNFLLNCPKFSFLPKSFTKNSKYEEKIKSLAKEVKLDMNFKEGPNIPVSGFVDVPNSETTRFTISPDSKEYKQVQEKLLSTIRDPEETIHYIVTQIETVKNNEMRERYDNQKQIIKKECGQINEKLLFHGSRSLKEILSNGFDQRYADINGTFGAGLYFSEQSYVSNQYVYGVGKGCPSHNEKSCNTCSRQLLLCLVALGEVFEQHGVNHWAHVPPEHHSVKGTTDDIIFPEFVVYKGDQVYPKYILTYKIVKPDDVSPRDM